MDTARLSYEAYGPIVDRDEEATHVLSQLPVPAILGLLDQTRVVLLLPLPVHAASATTVLASGNNGKCKNDLLRKKRTLVGIYYLK